MTKSEIINIYTVKFVGLGWLLEVISTTINILVKKKNYKIRIILLDDFNESYLKDRIKFTLFKNKNKIKFLDIKKLKPREIFNSKSIDSKLLLRKKIQFIYQNLNFEIFSTKQNFFLLTTYKVISLLIAIYYFLKLSIFSSKRDFIKFEYLGVRVGDLVASNFLRDNPKYGGEFKYSFQLFKIFFSSIFYTLKTKPIINKYNNVKKSFTIIPEPTYLQALWKRTFLKYGIPNIEMHHYKGKIVINRNPKKYYPWIAEKKVIKKISQKEKLIINNYFKTRFTNPGKIMSYLTHENSNNNSINSIYDQKNNKIKLDKDKLIPVIFLHSFDDAQYCFGVDGFNDIYHWTIFSIEKCLENKNFDKVFIKPHPGSDFINYPGDKVAFHKILDKYANNDRVVILKKNSSILSLSKNIKLLGITHHGSIAEELTFLSQNVIAFINGQWGKNYKFLNTWKTKNEYGIFLKKFSKDLLVRRTKQQSKHFNNYILECKINIIERRDSSIRVFLSKTKNKYRHWYTPRNHILGFNDYVKFMRSIENNDTFINDIIKPIYDRNHN